MGKAAKKIEAEYYIPHLAHATMEPPAATVRIKDGKCDVWTCVQAPQVTRTDVAEQLGMKFEDVTVHVTLLGGGFGRKSKPDFAVEAALLSKEMGGAPVKLMWTREDDIRNSYYHTVSVERVEAGMDAAGKPVAWRHRSVAPSIVSIFAPDPKHQGPFELGMGLVDVPFDIPNLRCENGEAEAHTRIGWFRSVSNIPHAFAVQSFAAEMAHAAGKDQKDYLLELLGPARVAELKSLEVTLGSKFTKNSIGSHLRGENSLAEMLGIYFGDQDQFFDHHTWQLHESPHATSDLEFKGALKEGARSSGRTPS